MHLSGLRNLIDYILYSFFTFGVTYVSAHYMSGIEPDVLISLAISMLVVVAVAYRDGQYRRVPVELAATPSRYVAEITALLEGGIDQIRESQRIAHELAQQAQDVRASLDEAQQAIYREPVEGFEGGLGRGFS